MNRVQRGARHRKQLSALSGINNLLGPVFDAVNDGIFLSDPITGRFVATNNPGSIMFGYRDTELVGRDIASLSSGIYPYTQEVALERAKRARLGEAQTFEWQCKTKAGDLFWTEISISYAEIGNAPFIVAIVRNIARRKQSDEDLKLALQKASTANKAKSTFLANMSHELRTPLNAIIGFSDLMLTQQLGPLANPRYREYIDDIHKSGLQLLALIDDLLDLSRIDAGQATLYEEEVSLHDLITQACRMVELQAKQAGVQIVIGLPGDLPDVRGDGLRIKQIVLNLLSNAIKFTPEAGTVTVKATQSASGILLEVSDTGIGIAEVDLPKVLERFGQVDNRYSRKHKGTGLGLPLVKQLIELHGGSLSIESKVDVGTVVAVTFPSARIIKTTKSVAA